MSNKPKLARNIIFGLTLTATAILWVFPFVWMVMNSLKPSDVIIQPKINLLFTPTLEHFRFILIKQPFLRFTLNSIFVAVTVTCITLFLGTTTAYAISRYGVGGGTLKFWILLTRMLPPPVLLIPLFIIFRTMGLLNTLTALVMADITFLLSFVIWVMKGFFEDIPMELEDSAVIDGCSRYQSFTKVILPLASPGLVSASILTFIFAWNEYLFALVFATSTRVKTLPVAAGDFITGYAVNWGPVFAASTLIVIPVFLLVVFMQRYIIRGLTLGSFR